MDTVHEHVYPAALRAAHDGKIVAMIPGTHDDAPCVYLRYWNEPVSYRHVTRAGNPATRAAFLVSMARHARELARQHGITT